MDDEPGVFLVGGSAKHRTCHILWGGVTSPDVFLLAGKHGIVPVIFYV